MFVIWLALLIMFIFWWNDGKSDTTLYISSGTNPHTLQHFMAPSDVMSGNRKEGRMEINLYAYANNDTQIFCLFERKNITNTHTYILKLKV